eukprot:gene22086-2581_t
MGGGATAMRQRARERRSRCAAASRVTRRRILSAAMGPHAGLAKAKAAGRGKPAKALPLVKDPVCKGKPGTLKTLSCVANMHNYDFKYDIDVGSNDECVQ